MEGRGKGAECGGSGAWGWSLLNTQYVQDELAALFCRARILGTRDIKKYNNILNTEY